jgi:predicted ArsR family transcriptional regulator
MVFLVDALSALARPELRNVVLFAREQAGPVSADDVATAFRVHRTVARGRLERLVLAGLLDVAFERRSGRTGPGSGRPTKLYGVPPETEALEFPRRHYERLLGHLLDAVPDGDRESTFTRVGVEFARDLTGAAALGPARGIRSATERACAALRKLGFQAAVSETSEDRATITTATCPLRPLVISNPDAAAIDRGMWAGLVGAYLPGRRLCGVSCETHGCLDDHASCRVVLDFQTDRPTTAQHPQEATEEDTTCTRTDT